MRMGTSYKPGMPNCVGTGSSWRFGSMGPFITIISSYIPLCEVDKPSTRGWGVYFSLQILFSFGLIKAITTIYFLKSKGKIETFI